MADVDPGSAQKRPSATMFTYPGTTVPPLPAPDFTQIPLPPDVDRSSFQASSSTSPVACAGWLYKTTVRRTVLGLFPNAGRHFDSWNRRWFVLYKDGMLSYYRERDEIDVEDPWSLVDNKDAAESAADAPTPPPKGRGSLIGNLFGGKGDTQPPSDETAEKERRPSLTKKTLELRGELQLTEKTVCQGHFYSSSKHELSIKGMDNSDELLIRCETAADFDLWLLKTNEIVSNLLHKRAEKKSRKGLSELAFYVKRRLSLEHSIRDPVEGEEAALADAPKDATDEAFVEVDVAAIPPPTAPECKNAFHRSPIPPPPLKIVILVVGTRGDVSPFIAMGKKLKAAGHTVRIATHTMYRQDVMKNDLLFYPLGGDPVMLSGFMVKTGGKLMPNLLDLDEIKDHAEDIPIKLQMLEEICVSTWPACTAPDPEDPDQTPFVAESIISNPVTYGHTHCAEALGVPLHLFFPQPWTPTKAFPHVFASLPQSKGWSNENFLSYYFVDQFMWLGTEGFVNDFREEVLGLPMLRRGELGGHRLNTLRVPFCYMFSPSLVPKPKDWPVYTDVVGNFFAAGSSTFEDKELQNYLDEDLSNPPIFVGFGSMVIAEPEKLASVIADAAKKTNTRVLIQSSWSKLAVGEEGGSEKKLVYCLGNCPHDWLFPQMAAVVHHGGAGTVAAGLRAGKPTLVCPFFGDQFFWGEVTHRAGVGPPPIPAVALTVESLSFSFNELKSESMRQRAEEMSAKFEKEDGVAEGINAFNRNLPTEDMVCDVSLFLPEAHCARPRTMVACRWCSECQMKMSLAVDIVVHKKGGGREGHQRGKYAPVDWGTSDGPGGVIEGFVQGFAGLGQEVISAVTGVIVEPIKGGREGGLKGGLLGVVTGLQNLVLRPLKGGVILVDKTRAGVATGVESRWGKDGGKRYVIYDKLFGMGRKIGDALGRGDKVGKLVGGEEDGEVKEREKGEMELLQGMEGERVADILWAYEIARECKDVFDEAEGVRTGGSKGTEVSAEMMRNLSSAIDSSRRGRGGGRRRGGGEGTGGGVKEDVVKIFQEEYFGIRGGRVEFTAFVSQFLFKGGEAEGGEGGGEEGERRDKRDL